MKGFIKNFAIISCLVFNLFNGDCMSMETQKNGEAHSDISDSPSNYLCEKSEQWIKNNHELINNAQKNEKAFAKLIQELKNDISLNPGESVRIYRDIRQYWGVEQKFAVTCNDVDFLSEIFECDTYDDF